MSTIKRAVTFLLRKRYKTVILILIFTVLCAVASTAVCAARMVHKPVNRVMRY